MQCKPILTCLALFLSSASVAQSNPSETSQPVANVQAQSETKASQDGQEDSDKTNDSDRDHKLHVRLGGVSIGAGYISSPFFFSPFWPYGFYPYDFGYSPFFYSPFYSPFYWPYPGGFAYAPDKGQVKLKVNLKNAEVFLDGAYAGTVDHLKDMWLDSGAYNLSVSAPAREPFQQRIYVLSGKTLKIEAKLVPQKEKPQNQEKP